MGIYKNNKNKILQAIIEYLKTLPGGTVSTVGELLQVLFPGWDELFEEIWMSYELVNDLGRAAKQEGLYLDMSKHDGMVEGMPSNLDFAVYQKKPGKKCPYCGNRDTSKIMYGMPAFSEELEQDLENHRTALGGCCITGYDPTYHCFSCNKDFGKPPVLISKKGIETYANEIVEIRFEQGGFFQGRFVVTARRIENNYCVSILSFPEHTEEIQRNMSEKEWKSLIKRLYEGLFIHEWEKNYEDPYVLDGEQWSLEIKLTGKRVRNIYGSNAYPPYWNELVQTFKKLKKALD